MKCRWRGWCRRCKSQEKEFRFDAKNSFSLLFLLLLLVSIIIIIIIIYTYYYTSVLWSDLFWESNCLLLEIIFWHCSFTVNVSRAQLFFHYWENLQSYTNSRPVIILSYLDKQLFAFWKLFVIFVFSVIFRAEWRIEKILAVRRL